MAAVTYREFPIRVWSKSPGQINVVIHGLSPGGLSSTEPETIPYSRKLFEIEENGDVVDLLAAIRKRRGSEDILCRVGSILADLVLPPRIRPVFWDSLRTVVNGGQRLRLRLMLEVPELKSLPWEYLYIAPKPGVCDVSGFLALRQDISIVRHEDLKGPEPPTPRGGKYRMVAALASPFGEAPLDLDSDRAAIRSALDMSPKGVEISASWVDPAVFPALKEALSSPCDIFHFSGHGYFDEEKNTGALLLERPDRKSDPIEASKLSQLLKDANAKVAILSACETAQRTDGVSYGGVAAKLVLSGLAAVVASQYTLRDKNALAVTRLLYASLVSGEAVDDAVYQARKQIMQQSGLSDRDWGALVLYLRVEDGVVFPRDHGVSTEIPGPRIAPVALHIDLIGRDEQLRQLGDRLQPGINLSFHGSYGVGKTSLATALFSQTTAENRFRRGYIWRRIGKITPERAIELLASEFPGQQVSKFESLDDKVDAFRKLLEGFRSMLFGLDEVPDKKVAQAILEATRGCAVMMNGTAILNLDGAEDIEVRPLTAPDARNLFLSLSRLPKSDNVDLDLVDRICARMGLLPLGIKLAALKCAEGGESLQTLWQRLETAPSTIPDEEVRRLFRATFDELASSPCAQRILVRLECFPANEAPLNALRADEDNVEFFQAKDKLIALGLADSCGPDRLCQHPLLNVRSDDVAYRDLIATQRDHVERWLESYAASNRGNFPMLLQEQSNIIGLLDDLAARKDWNRLIGLLRNLFDYLRIKGLWREAFDKIDLCLQNEQYLTDANRGWALLHRAVLNTLLGRYQKALYDLNRAVERFRYDGDELNFGRAHYRRAIVHIMTGDLHVASEQLRIAIDTMAPRGIEAGPDLAAAYARLGGLLAQQASRDQAQEAFRKALSHAVAIDDIEEQARAYLGMGAMNQATDPDRAIADFSKALDLARSMGDELQVASVEQTIGYQHYYAERYDQAQTSFETALSTFRRFAYQPGIAKGLAALGNSALAQKRYEEAQQYYREAIKISDSLGQKGNVAYATYQLAIVAHRQGHLEDAERGYAESAKYAAEENDRVLQGAVLAQLAKLMFERGDQQAAERYARKAEEEARHLEDRLTQATALSVLGLVQKARGEETDAQDKLVAAASARAAMTGVRVNMAVRSAMASMSDQPEQAPLHSSATVTPNETLTIHGIPDRIVHDQNASFTSEDSKDSTDNSDDGGNGGFGGGLGGGGFGGGFGGSGGGFGGGVIP